MIRIPLVQEVMVDKHGMVQRDQQGEEAYRQNDVLVLKALFNVFDFEVGENKKHTNRQRRIGLSLCDKIADAWKIDADELQLTLEEYGLFRETILNPDRHLRADGQGPLGPVVNIVNQILNNALSQRTLFALEDLFMTLEAESHAPQEGDKRPNVSSEHPRDVSQTL